MGYVQTPQGLMMVPIMPQFYQQMVSPNQTLPQAASPKRGRSKSPVLKTPMAVKPKKSPLRKKGVTQTRLRGQTITPAPKSPKPKKSPIRGRSLYERQTISYKNKFSDKQSVKSQIES